MSQTNLKFVMALLLACAGGSSAQEQAGNRAVTPAPVSEASPTESSSLQSRPVLVVREFTVNEKTGWPYDLKQLQSETVAELRGKEKSVDVLIGAPATARTRTYTLDGEIVSWRAGNAAKRIMIGMGSGREAADIRYWLTDENGKRIFEHKDTIRAEFFGNVYAGSVGQLSHPFASKIVARLTQAKVF